MAVPGLAGIMILIMFMVWLLLQNSIQHQVDLKNIDGFFAEYTEEFTRAAFFNHASDLALRYSARRVNSAAHNGDRAAEYRVFPCRQSGDTDRKRVRHGEYVACRLCRCGRDGACHAEFHSHSAHGKADRADRKRSGINPRTNDTMVKSWIGKKPEIENLRFFVERLMILPGYFCSSFHIA